MLKNQMYRTPPSSRDAMPIMSEIDKRRHEADQGKDAGDQDLAVDRNVAERETEDEEEEKPEKKHEEIPCHVAAPLSLDLTVTGSRP